MKTSNCDKENEIEGKKKKITQKIGEGFLMFFETFKTNYKEIQRGPFIALLIYFGLLTAQMLRENLSQSIFVAVLLFLVIMFIVAFFLYLGAEIVKFIFRYNVVFLFYWGTLSYLLAKGITSGCIKVVRTESKIFSVVFALFILIFAKSFFAMFKQKRKKKMIIIVTAISGVLMISCFVILFGEGFKETKVDELKALVQESSYDCINAEELTEIDGKTVGPYQVGVLSYGEEGTESLESNTANISMYASDADGIYGMYRKMMLKMNLKRAKIKGLIWYPEDEINCPILFIMHGNHTINETSHDGYAYLGEYLASYGYMVVSVDENILNTLSGENDARAILFLKNMQMIENYVEEESGILYQKGDFSKVAIAGHSRGGESAAITYLFNQLEYYTENGIRKLSYDFDIQSIIAIAPSVDQFKPADHVVEIEDVNYLLLQGANDQDIYGYMGMNQYENISYSGDKDCFKTALYIANANHGQFNTKWGRYDLMFPNSRWINVKNLMEEEEQQQIAKTMIKTFLDITLLEQDENKELLYNYRKYESILPETVYIQQYNDSSQITYCDFEEDVNLETGTLPGVFISVSQVGIWTEAQEEYSNMGMKKARQNHVLKLKWTEKENPYVRIQLPEINIEGQILTFSICDADTRQVEEKIYELLECEVVVKDKNEHLATLNCKDYVTLYPPIPTKLGKIQYLTGDEEYKKVLQTVRIPIEDFKIVGEQVDFQSIIAIEIHIINKESGEVLIDKIGTCLE